MSKTTRAKVTIVLELDIAGDPDFDWDAEIAAKTAMDMAVKHSKQERKPKALEAKIEWGRKKVFKV